MNGSASVATDMLASYAADAAKEVEGVRGLVESRLPRHGAVRVNGEDGQVRVELHLELAWAPRPPRSAPRCSDGSPTTWSGWRERGPRTVDVVIDEIGPPS